MAKDQRYPFRNQKHQRRGPIQKRQSKKIITNDNWNKRQTRVRIPYQKNHKTSIKSNPAERGTWSILSSKRSRLTLYGQTCPVSKTIGIDADLSALATYVALTPEERTVRDAIVAEITKVIHTVFPHTIIGKYGSSCTGVDTFRSDVDLTVGGAFETPRKYYASSDSDVEVIETPSFSLNLALPPSQRASRALSCNGVHRQEKLRRLRALQRVITRAKPQYRIQCLSKARIPILMIHDVETDIHLDMGLHHDSIASSDHGQTTVQVTQWHQTLGPSFHWVVLFLKEYLHQFELNKPFTGGIGSFRIYVMVAHVMMKYKHLSPSQVLLQCLLWYGNKDVTFVFTKATRLKVHSNEVDFATVFRLEECIEMFGIAYDILIEKGSCLSAVLYVDVIEKDRQMCLKRVKNYLEGDMREREEESSKSEDNSSWDEHFSYSRWDEDCYDEDEW